MQTSYLEGRPLSLSKGPQLLLDSQLVEDRWGLTRVLNRPTKVDANPLLRRDKPWEGDGVSNPQVVRDEQRGCWRLWYTCYSRTHYDQGGGPVYWICHAESADGLHWEKPLYDHCPFGEHTRTNIVYYGTHPRLVNGQPATRAQMGHLFFDHDIERFRMVCLEGWPHPTDGQIHSGVHLLDSADGLHWRLPDGASPILDHHSDTSNRLIYDEARGRWLLYGRPTVWASGGHLTPRLDRRRVTVMTSQNLVDWTYPRMVLPNDEDDLWPGCDHTTVFRYGSHFLMFYTIMHSSTGQMQVCLASSEDGIQWERFRTRDTWLEPGPEGAWDSRWVLQPTPPQAHGTEMWFYYAGDLAGQHEREARGSHCGIGLATMPRDRFVAQQAGAEPAFLLTKEFTLKGHELTVNAAPNGLHTPELRVEVLRHPALGDHAGAYWREGNDDYHYPGFGLQDCRPLRADGTGQRVTWQDADLAELEGRPVYLRFALQGMDLFAFSIG